MASPTHHESDEHEGHDDVPSTLHLGSQNADFGLFSVQHLPVPLHINKVIVGELQNVLASMKLNSRWKDLSRATKESLALYNSLIQLKNRLENGASREIILPVTDYLSPFLEIVQSDMANGPITSIALSSILKFMQYGYLDMSNGIISLKALELIVTAAMNCKFEALGSENDAVVMFKILKVLQRSIEVDTALLMSSQLLYDMVQTCFKLSIQSRVSNLLRKAAEMTLTEIFRFAIIGCDSPIKARLIGLHIPPEIAQLMNQDDSDSSSVSTDASEPVRVNAQGVSFIKDSATTSTPATPVKSTSSTNIAQKKGTVTFVPTAPPFGVDCLIKLLRFLCTMINPKDPSSSEPMRYLGLTLVNIVFELRGESLAAHKRLLDVISNDVCRHLIHSVRSEDGLSLLSITMRICNNIFSSSLRANLGFQLDLFIKSILAYFPEYESDPAPRPKNPNGMNEVMRGFDQKELALDVLVQLCRDPTFAVDLVVNYDCQLSGPNLLETLIKFFENINDPRMESQDANPDEIRSLRTFSHSALSSIMTSMSSRWASLKDRKSSPVHFDTNSETVETTFGHVPSLSALKARRTLKATMKTGAEKYNAKPKDGIDYMVEKGVLPNPVTAHSIAVLFRTNPFISKAAIGDYLGVRKDLNTEVLKAYALSFGWEGRGFFELFREFLESFRIPGESPVIEHIVDTWTRLYLHQFDVEEPLTEEEISQLKETTPETDSSEQVAKPKVKIVNKHPIFRTLDACYMVAVSVVLLNVDMYNPNVKANRRMTIDHYVHNLRGQNGKENFPPEFLKAIYTAIRASEIKVVEEHMSSGTAEIPQSTWVSMWTKQTNAALSLPPAETQLAGATLKAGRAYGIYDEMIFNSIWKVLISTTKNLWQETHASQTETISSLSSVFYAIGNLAAHFNASPAFDALIGALTEISTILQPYKDYSFEVRFTQDKKAQSATSILFGLAHLHTNVIREGWKSINDMMIVLQSQSTLPPILEEVTDDSVFQFKDLPPPIATSAASLQSKPSNTSSPISTMFSSLWKWGSGAAAAALGPDSAADESGLPAELERYRSATKQILVDCHLPDVISACSRVDPDSLLFFMQVLILGSSPGPAKPKPSPASPPIQPSHSDGNLSVSAPPPASTVPSDEKDEKIDLALSEQTPNPNLQHPQPERASPTSSTHSASIASPGASTPSEPTKSSPSTPQPKVSLAQPTLNPQTHRRLAPRPGSKNRFEDSVALYCVDMLTHLALLNAHRVALVWPIVSNHFAEIIKASEKPSPLTERAITSLLVIVAKLMPVAVGIPALGYFSDDLDPSVSVASHMCKTLEQSLSASALGSELSKAYSHRISHAMRVILRRNAKAIGNASSSEWQALLDAVCANMMDSAEHMENLIDVISSSLVKGIIPASLATSAQAFTTTRSSNDPSSHKLDLVALASSTLISTQNIRAVHSSVLKLLTHGGASLDALVEGMDCAQALLVLGPQHLPGTTNDPVWHGYLLNGFVLPIFSVMSQLAHDNRIVVRQTSLSQLQKAFGSSGLSFASSDDWLLLFHRIIFPLLDGMLSPPEGAKQTNATREATEEAFMRAMAVLSKTYLHCMTFVAPTSLAELWKQVLLRYARFYQNGNSSEIVQESVVQSVKNTLSVMHSSRILLTSLPAAPIDSTGESEETATSPEVDENTAAKFAIWTESWPIVDQFAPSLRAELAARTGTAPPAPISNPTPIVANPTLPQQSNSSEMAASVSSSSDQAPIVSNPISVPIATPQSPSNASLPGSPSSRANSPMNPPGTVLEL